MKMEKCIVTEVAVQLDNFNQAKAFGILLTNQLEECGFSGSEHTERFDLVNHLGADKEGYYYVNFLGHGENLKEFESSVKAFLDEFIEDLKNPEYLDDFMTLLEEDEEMPKVKGMKGYKIIVTRPYKL